MTSVVLLSPGKEMEARPKSRMTFGGSEPQGQELSTKAGTGHAGAHVGLGGLVQSPRDPHLVESTPKLMPHSLMGPFMGSSGEVWSPADSETQACPPPSGRHSLSLSVGGCRE